MKLKVMSEIRKNVNNIFNKADFYQNTLYDYDFCHNGVLYYYCPSHYVRSGSVQYHNEYLWFPQMKRVLTMIIVNFLFFLYQTDIFTKKYSP